MLRDDRAGGEGRRRAARNVLGETLEICSITPMTGFYRDGCCNTGREDMGSHTVCAVMTAAFSSSFCNVSRRDVQYFTIKSGPRARKSCSTARRQKAFSPFTQV
jgi:uncharacterized protein (DUF2237 family)